ncbi:unnamed protein product [Didymodactylos carnosus]|uniref:Torsin-1A C-terminal domain-containing protein n=1 Tax=Didymodactylos carnosus TaxID=1234261 RepID=A0A814NY37_9BILA|nr:unnamed protein product [Didymodactylos carnosus]CAF1096487.1 unnamed protein product [Didymodactylos carnosus]CAF3773817.1 unnamed protein product [Didymodactylos carnosus]CAF3861768.1 unnamed protein product [Didymodactylos carnosus]
MKIPRSNFMTAVNDRTFLPLEREHIRMCIQRQLDIIIQQEKEVILSPVEKNVVIDNVIDLIEFAPPDTALYSVSGCKKVQQKLYYVLEKSLLSLLRADLLE